MENLTDIIVLLIVAAVIGTDLYFEILPQLVFLRKRMTVQRLMHITRQMCWDDDTIDRIYIKRQVYFIKK